MPTRTTFTWMHGSGVDPTVAQECTNFVEKSDTPTSNTNKMEVPAWRWPWLPGCPSTPADACISKDRPTPEKAQTIRPKRARKNCLVRRSSTKKFTTSAGRRTNDSAPCYFLSAPDTLPIPLLFPPRPCSRVMQSCDTLVEGAAAGCALSKGQPGGSHARSCPQSLLGRDAIHDTRRSVCLTDTFKAQPTKAQRMANLKPPSNRKNEDTRPVPR